MKNQYLCQFGFIYEAFYLFRDDDDDDDEDDAGCVCVCVCVCVQCFKYQKQKLFWDESWIIDFNHIKQGECVCFSVCVCVCVCVCLCVFQCLMCVFRLHCPGDDGQHHERPSRPQRL